MNIQTITLQEALPVRHQVLWPNKPIEFCIVKGDEAGVHFGAKIDNKIVSVASIYIDNREARLRKFATYSSYQGRGIGTAILEHILNYLRNQDVDYFWCDARESAINFYQRFNMKSNGKRFYKSDVPYVKMSVDIT